MPDRAIYSIRKNRFESGLYPGFELGEDGVLRACEHEASHYLYMRAVDSGRDDSEWGRLTIDIERSEDMICYIRVAAMNEDSFYREEKPVKIQDFLCDENEGNGVKKEFFRRVGALRFVNREDMLMYSLKGRYLYLMVEIIGEGSCEIGALRIDAQGDNFMRTFPGIYQERDSFFHRWLSVFSSMYNDFETDIGRLHEMLDPEACPAKLLPVYASWLGVDVGNDFLDEQTLRVLVKEAYRLNRMKGTKAALERAAEIVLGEKVQVLEQNVMADYVEPDKAAEFERLYGDSVYDVTILVKGELTEIQKSRLIFMLNQFKPARARLHVVRMKPGGVMDSYSYMDMNASISDAEQGIIDERQAMDGSVRMD